MSKVMLEHASPFEVLDCPNLHGWFEKDEAWRFHPDYGVAISFHYLGGHENKPWEPVAYITAT